MADDKDQTDEATNERVTDDAGMFVGTEEECDKYLAESPIPFPIPDEMLLEAERQAGSDAKDGDVPE